MTHIMLRYCPTDTARRLDKLLQTRPPGTTMKPSKSSIKPMNPKQFPLHAQTDATAGRDKVREVVPVHAPRQSKRAVERTSKG